jgi:dTDP-4-dehydrorhamnose 3,5-epimerase
MKLNVPPEGCSVFDGMVFGDARGDTLCHKADAFETMAVKQVMVVTNKPGVVRGLHCAQYAKQVVCLTGEIFDVLVDARKDSQTYGDWFGIYLSGSQSLMVAPGIAHGYLSLGESTVLYSLEGSWTEAKRDRTVFWKDPAIGVKWPETDGVLSEKDAVSTNTLASLNQNLNSSNGKRVLVYGGTGYLGTHACDELRKSGWEVRMGEVRCTDYQSTLLEIDAVKPDVVFGCVGKSGIPSSTWHDEHPVNSLENNVLAVYFLGKACNRRRVRCVVLGTGFVFSGGSNEFPIQDDESHSPQNTFYCHMRSVVEKTLSKMNNVLTLRVNFPTTADTDPRGMFGKMTNAQKVHSNGSSITVVPSLFPHLGAILVSDVTGAINFVNTGSVSPKGFADLMGRGDGVQHFDTSNASVCVLSTEKLSQIVQVAHVDVALKDAWESANQNTCE